MKRIKIKNRYCRFDKINSLEILGKNWRLTWNGYAVNEKMVNYKKTRMLMHHLVLGKKDGYEIDHINGNKLDNRLCNLRHVTRSQNNMNKKNVKGYIKTKEGNYQANIGKDGKKICLGTYKTIAEAKASRRIGEIKYFGEYAR